MNSSWGCDQLEFLPSDTDILVAEFCMNDASFVRGVTPRKSIQNHRRIIAFCRSRGIAPVLCTMSPASGTRGLARPWLATYQNQYRVLARDADVPLLDVLPDWEARIQSDGCGIIPDGVHPTDEATTRVYSQRLAGFLFRVLSSATQ